MLSLKWMPEIYSFPLTDAQQLSPRLAFWPWWLAVLSRLLSVGCDTIPFPLAS